MLNLKYKQQAATSREGEARRLADPVAPRRPKVSSGRRKTLSLKEVSPLPQPPGLQQKKDRRHLAVPPIATLGVRQVSSTGADVPVAQIGGLAHPLFVLAAQARQPVGRVAGHRRVLGRLQPQAIKTRGVATEDHLLHRTVRAAESGKAMFLLHVLGDFQAAHGLDLPLWRAVPNRIGSPQHVVGTEALDQRADQGRGKLRMRHGRGGEGGSDLTRNVTDPELPRYFRQIGGPLDATRQLELLPSLLWQLEKGAQGRVVDDEGHAGLVLGGFADVRSGRVLPDAGERLLVVGRQQSLVNADDVDAGLLRLLVEGIHHLLVVEPPRELGGAQRIADGVGFPGIGLIELDRLVDLLHPTRLLGRDDGVRQKSPRAGEVVDHLASAHDLLVGKQPPGGIIEGRAGQERDVGVAVVIDLLDVVLEFVANERIGVALERRIPVLGGELCQIQQFLVVEIVAHEMRLHVENELTAQALRPCPGELGLARLGRVDLEYAGAIDLVHGEKGSGHAAARLHELPAAQSETLAVVVGELKDAPLDALLRLALRRRKIFTIGHNLRWDRRGGGSRLCTCHQPLLSFTQPTAHRGLSPIRIYRLARAYWPSRSTLLRSTLLRSTILRTRLALFSRPDVTASQGIRGE